MEDKLFFISMEGRSEHYIDGFKVREDVPLPVLIPESETISTDHITSENMMAGMLKIIENEPDHENLDYYRSFIYTVRPDIEAHMSSIAYEAETNFHFSEAIGIYTLILTLNPTATDMLLNLAVCYDEFAEYTLSKGDEQQSSHFKDKASEYFIQIDALKEKNERAYYYLGRFYTENSNYSKAIDYFQEFIKSTKDDERKKEAINFVNELRILGLEDDLYKNALFHYECEKYEESLKFISGYIHSYPHSWHGHYLKGQILYRMGQFRDAINSYSTALESNIESSEILNSMGLSYMEIGEYSKSNKYFFKALNIDPDNLSIYYNLALLAKYRSDYLEAIKFCDIILEFNKDDIPAKTLKNELTRNHA